MKRKRIFEGEGVIGSPLRLLSYKQKSHVRFSEPKLFKYVINVINIYECFMVGKISYLLNKIYNKKV